MSSTTAPRFKFFHQPKDGHRYFETTQGSQRLAIADNSGSTPENTDDGILYLDTSRPVKVADGQFYAPLVDPDGRHSSTPISDAEAAWLCGAMQLRLIIAGQPFQLTAQPTTPAIVGYRYGGRTYCVPCTKRKKNADRFKPLRFGEEPGRTCASCNRFPLWDQ